MTLIHFGHSFYTVGKGRNTTGTYVSEVHGWTLLDVVGMLLGMMEHDWNDEVKSTARRMLP